MSFKRIATIVIFGGFISATAACNQKSSGSSSAQDFGYDNGGQSQSDSMDASAIKAREGKLLNTTGEDIIFVDNQGQQHPVAKNQTWIFNRALLVDDGQMVTANVIVGGKQYSNSFPRDDATTDKLNWGFNVAKDKSGNVTITEAAGGGGGGGGGGKGNRAGTLDAFNQNGGGDNGDSDQ